MLVRLRVIGSVVKTPPPSNVIPELRHRVVILPWMSRCAPRPGFLADQAWLR
jgi:hypothetical protein